MPLDEIGGIMNFIDKYGLPLVITAIFLWQAIKTNRKMEKIAEENETWMRKILEGKLCAPPLTMNEMSTEQNKQHAEEDEFLTKINMRKIDIMTRAKKEVGATRVQQFAYHNNAKDYLGRSFQRMSCENEVVAPGVKPVQNNYNNIFRSFFYHIYKELNEHRNLDIWDIEDIKHTDMGMYDMASADNIKSAFFYSIKNEKGLDVGYVCFTFDKIKNKVNDSRIVEIVKDTAIQLQGLNYTDS